MDNIENYWTQRYRNKSTGWDVGYPTTPIKNYIDQLGDKTIAILIPGAGNAYEAEYLFKNKFSNCKVIDISNAPLEAFKKRVPLFPQKNVIQGDFFEHQGAYDLILEQTFFCSFPPTADNRNAYAKKAFELLKPGGKLVGLWFDVPLTTDMLKRPFGGTIDEYKSYFDPYFETIIFEKCYNSIPPRQGTELFGIFVKK